ncbi:MAG: DegT/DnrJ/EryC1/StrS family aminotransferase [Magnetococcus sp. DMHC-6]
MSDVLLGTDVVVDICAKRQISSLEALHHAEQKADRLWIYTGSVQTLQYILADELKKSESPTPIVDHVTQAKELLGQFTKGKNWLSALAEDGDVYDQPDLEVAQLILAVNRLGKKAKLLTRNRALLERCSQAVSPEQYLEQSSESASIAFIDLEAQQDLLRPDMERNIHIVFQHGNYIMGPEVSELESKLAEFAGVKHAISCSSGTDALLMGLMAYDIGPGDAVFTTTFTFIATAEVVSLLGATPVFVDIDPKTFNIDPAKLERAILKVKQEGKLIPRGIIPVDLFGLPADYDAIDLIAEKNGLFVIEDAAQGFGGVYKGKQAGSFGHAAATSFFPAKPLGCYGDGGALFTNDDQLAEKFISFRVHGKGSEKYDNIRIGVNARLDTLQAAILLPKLAVFPKELLARQQVANRYELGLKNFVETPQVPRDYFSAWAQYSILSDRRDDIQAALKKAGIPSGIYYPKSLHLQTAFHTLGYQEGDFPIAEMASRRVLGLPMHPYLKPVDIDRIVHVIQGVFK